MAARTLPNNTTQTSHGIGTNKANAGGGVIGAGSPAVGHSITVWADGTVWDNTSGVALEPSQNFPRFHDLFRD